MIIVESFSAVTKYERLIGNWQSRFILVFFRACLNLSGICQISQVLKIPMVLNKAIHSVLP